jgi:hypothetical protein
MDIGAVAELVFCLPHSETRSTYAALLSEHAKVWLANGTLENVIALSNGFQYYAALFLRFAATDSELNLHSIEVVRALYGSGCAGRNETPFTTRALIASHLRAVGINTSMPPLSIVQIQAILDRRNLRPRTDHYDLMGLMFVAQLVKLGFLDCEKLDSRFAQVFFVHALRERLLNWLPVLAVLCDRYFHTPLGAQQSAAKVIDEAAAKMDGLFPGVMGTEGRDELVEFSEVGMRLRSSIAYLALADA